MSASHWTDETDVEAAIYFDTLSTTEIRRRQDLCTAQLRLAFDQRNEHATIDLQRMQNALTDAVLRRC